MRAFVNGAVSPVRGAVLSMSVHVADGGDSLRDDTLDCSPLT